MFESTDQVTQTPKRVHVHNIVQDRILAGLPSGLVEGLDPGQLRKLVSEIFEQAFRESQGLEVMRQALELIAIGNAVEPPTTAGIAAKDLAATALTQAGLWGQQDQVSARTLLRDAYEGPELRSLNACYLSALAACREAAFAATHETDDFFALEGSSEAIGDPCAVPTVVQSVLKRLQSIADRHASELQVRKDHGEVPKAGNANG